MKRRKERIDYKILSTTGKKVIKDTCVNDITTLINDLSLQEQPIMDSEEVENLVMQESLQADNIDDLME